ncbi:hypothetical protein BKA67DRAFT_232176 [Truncatella angustata]|uniref:Uncharacterized protein n=1 Tax=Truncatella angustata TaxID=152316 RepID=A0A9P8UN18_9PEZI|nr:uncharacterized protein BKA67DRAFT_232176 [Truncatella angustata]KAH6655276.1 hypothetical protein BKA67DRAFT_232176 [Truncatella angustata]
MTCPSSRSLTFRKSCDRNPPADRSSDPCNSTAAGCVLNTCHSISWMLDAREALTFSEPASLFLQKTTDSVRNNCPYQNDQGYPFDWTIVRNYQDILGQSHRRQKRRLVHHRFRNIQTYKVTSPVLRNNNGGHKSVSLRFFGLGNICAQLFCSMKEKHVTCPPTYSPNNAEKTHFLASSRPKLDTVSECCLFTDTSSHFSLSFTF